MTTDPRIEAAAKAVCESRHRHHKTKRDYWTDAGDYAQGQYRDDARAALAAADKAATITTVEGLDALPIGAVVASLKYVHPAGYPVSFQRLHGGDWHRGGRLSDTHPENIVPARVIHWGTE